MPQKPEARRSRYDERSQKARCVQCGGSKGKPDKGRTMCEACLASARARSARCRDRRRANGTCTECQNPPAQGHAICQYHLDARVARDNARVAAGKCRKCGNSEVVRNMCCRKCTLVQAEAVRRRSRKFRQLCDEDGICFLCGVRMARDGFRSCQECADARSRSGRDRKAKLRAAGLCVNCGKTETDGGAFCRLCHCKGVAYEHLGSAKLGQQLLDMFDAQGGRCAMSGRPKQDQFSTRSLTYARPLAGQTVPQAFRRTDPTGRVLRHPA